MPNYSKGKGRFVHKQFQFNDYRHMNHFLSRTHHEDPVWVEHFKNKAAENPDGFKKRALRKIATKRPSDLVNDVFAEFRQKQRGEAVGGGIAESISFFAGAAADRLGYQHFKEFIGMAPEHREITNEDSLFAQALSDTYKEEGERSATIGGLKRLPQFDTPRYSVWEEPNGQLLVTVHGTELDNTDDWGHDAKIMIGETVDSHGLQQLFKQLDGMGKTYDIAAHSLGTQFVVNAEKANADKILLFNPASSPFQNSEYLEEQANNEDYTFFINPNDLVSKALWQKMEEEQVNNSYIAHPTYSPLSAHSMGQWLPEEVEDTHE